MKIGQKFFKLILLASIPLFCFSWVLFGVTLALKNATFSPSGSVSYEVPILETTAYPNIKFTLSTTNGTATATAVVSSSSGAVVVPSKVLSNGQVYTVTKVDGEVAGNLTSIVIPATVTYIEFSGSNKLTSVTFQEGSQLETLRSHAFHGCSNLTSINIPESVTSIGQGAFFDCVNLTEIILPPNLISISALAFINCISLTSITIPASVTSIGDEAFRGCSSLTSIDVEGGNTVYHSNGNCLIETASKTLIAGCKNSIIPSDGSVTSIGHGAFGGCSSLTGITIPASVTSIGSYAFRSCTSLTSATFEGLSGHTWEVNGSGNAGIYDVTSDIADPTTAATYLTTKYYSYIWTRT